MREEKAQTSLRIRAVWSESSLSRIEIMHWQGLEEKKNKDTDQFEHLWYAPGLRASFTRCHSTISEHMKHSHTLYLSEAERS